MSASVASGNLDLPVPVDVVPFDTVHSMVEDLNDRNLDDQVIDLKSVLVDSDLTIMVPDIGWAEMTKYSQSQLGSILGVQFYKWFAGIDGEQIQHEMSLRLPRLEKYAKRLVRTRDREDEETPLVRAFLSPGYETIDDLRVFDRLGGDELRPYVDAFYMLEDRMGLPTDHAKVSYYTMAFGQMYEVDGQFFWPAIQLGNSEIGAKSLTMDLVILSLDGLWGFLQPERKRLLYRQHRKIEDDQLDAQIEMALLSAHDMAQTFLETMRSAAAVAVDDPSTTIYDFLHRRRFPRRVIRRAVEVSRDFDVSTAFDVGCVLSRTAQHHEDPEKRDELEHAACLYIKQATI